MAVLVDLQQVTARRVDRTLFEDLSLTVSDGDRIGLVGINGTGKSTLLRLVAGEEGPEAGQVRRGRGARVGFLEQDPHLPPGSVGAAVGEGWEAEAVLERLGMGHAVATDVSELSGGQAKRVALASVLVRPFELLVLDEPTNHLDMGTVAWLEQRLLAFRGGLVLVTHDRHLLDRVTTRILELDRGRSFVHEGGYSSYLEARAERAEQAASAEDKRQNLARRELAWLRRGAPARTRKPQARIDAAVRVIDDRPEAPARSNELEMAFGTPRLGTKVIECAGVAFRYGPDDPPVLAGIDLLLDRRERLGVVGANGTGKSTLLDLLAGRRQPTMGTIELGPTVVVGYYDQRGVDLDPRARVRELVAGPGRAPGAVEDVALMERFWLGGELAFARVGTLSGGERRRLQLLLVLVARPNVLLLDEPTNDLDLDTLRILEDFLEEWPGVLVVVSHDRTFLDRTTERLVALEADGRMAPVVGGLAAWVARAGAPPSGGSLRAGGVTPSSAATGAKARRGPSVSADGPGGSAGPDGSAGSASSGGSAGPGGSAGSASSAGSAGSGGNVRRRLREAEKEMARRQRRRDQLSELLAGTVGHAELARVGSELAEAQAGLDEAEERWLELAEEAEAGR